MAGAFFKTPYLTFYLFTCDSLVYVILWWLNKISSVMLEQYIIILCMKLFFLVVVIIDWSEIANFSCFGTT